MEQTRVFIRQALHKLLPLSIIGEVACFVFYDHHPRDVRCLDVTVCSNRGEVLEYYKHALIGSLLIDSIGPIKEIRIVRNSKCELFYLVATRDEIIILSRKENLQIHNRVSNIQTYSIEDSECTGQACLKIFFNDDAVPLVFDDNFVNLTGKQLQLNETKSEESLPVFTQLMRKLTEAKYTTNHNEQKYKQYLNLRQTAAFSIYQKTMFNLEDSDTELSLNTISNLLQITAKIANVKLYNKKIILIINVQNNNNTPINDVCILLNTDSSYSVEHITKLFQNISDTPFWKETDVHISSFNESIVVAIIDVKEYQFDIDSRINFEIAISYTKNDKNHLLPMESVSISTKDIMGENFDMSFDCDNDLKLLLLSILSTSHCFELRLRHIKKPGDGIVTPSDIFVRHLKMDLYFDNVAIHKMSQFHILYGVMVVFMDNVGDTNVMNVQVYTRNPSQILALIHYIYDTVPYRIIATTPDYNISALNKALSNYNENAQTTDQHISYTSCASSILNQIKIMKDYFNDCMIKMSEDKSPLTKEKLGHEIDLIALGVPKYLEFRDKILKENAKGIKGISLQESPDSDCMIID